MEHHGVPAVGERRHMKRYGLQGVAWLQQQAQQQYSWPVVAELVNTKKPCEYDRTAHPSSNRVNENDLAS